MDFITLQSCYRSSWLKTHITEPIPFSISYETWREPMCARSRVILIAAGAVLWHYDVVLLLLLQCCNQSEQHNARDTMGQGPASGSIMSWPVAAVWPGIMLIFTQCWEPGPMKSSTILKSIYTIIGAGTDQRFQAFIFQESIQTPLL